jgi:hypothetical protein
MGQKPWNTTFWGGIGIRGSILKVKTSIKVKKELFNCPQ